MQPVNSNFLPKITMSYAINEQDFDRFMKTCHPSVKKYIKQETPGYKLNGQEPILLWYTQTAISTAQRYAAMCYEVEQTVIEANERLVAADEKILEIAARVKTLEAKNEEQNTNEELAQKSSVLVQEWQAKLSGFVDFGHEDIPHRNFTEEWPYEPDKTLWFVNPDTLEVMDASVPTRPIVVFEEVTLSPVYTNPSILKLLIPYKN